MVRRIAFLAVLSLLLAPAASARKLTDDDAGRLLVWNAPGNSGANYTYLVFQELGKAGRLRCTYFGNDQRLATVMPSQVRLLPFAQDVTPLTVTQYALYSLANGRSERIYTELCRRIPSPRGESLREAEAATTEALRRLQTLAMERMRLLSTLTPPAGTPRQNMPTPLDTRIVRACEQARTIDLIGRAIQEKDFFQAMALFEYHRRVMQRYAARMFFGATDLNRKIADFFRNNEQALLKDYRASRRGLSVREREFQNLCPGQRGLWSEGDPVSYRELLELFERSFHSFASLGNLSALSEFPSWGNAALNALLLLPEGSAASPLIKEFDAAYARYRTRVTGAGKKP